MSHNPNQIKALERLRKALESHKTKPTDATAALVMKHYDGILRETLTAAVLTKEEVAVLQTVTQPEGK